MRGERKEVRRRERVSTLSVSRSIALHDESEHLATPSVSTQDLTEERRRKVKKRVRGEKREEREKEERREEQRGNEER